MADEEKRRSSGALTWLLPDGSLSIMDFDATLSEQHGVSAMITEHPVAQGAAIVDHVRPNQDTLSIDIFITDTPTNLVVPQIGKNTYPKFGAEGVSVFNNSYTKKFNRVQEVYKKLRLLSLSGTFVDVHTTVRHYKNMLISDMSAPRSAADGTSMTFTLELRQVRIVQSETVAIPDPVEVRAKGTRGKGGQGEKPVDEKTQDNASTFSRLTGLGKAI